MMLKFNIHSHTYRCGHANGEDEEYVRAAIDAGFREMGFSDHVFLPGIEQPAIRGDYSLLDEYVGSVHRLQKEYEGKIKIHLGFECEWYGDAFSSYYQSLLKEKGFDYLILGQHCYLEGGELLYYTQHYDAHTALSRYVDDVIAGMESGLFTYVCHPDIMIRWIHEWNPFVEGECLRLIEAARELGIPLEVNCGPSRFDFDNVSKKDSHGYPCYRFWELVARLGAKATIGVDAHSPSDYARTNYDFFDSFVRELGLDLVLENPIKKKNIWILR